MGKIGLQHINFLTDNFSIWQHTNGNEIDRVHGYALDDGARALIVAIHLKDFYKAKIYLDFLKKAVGGKQIINFYDSDKKPLFKPWSEDALAEAYWALSFCLFHSFESDQASNIIQSITPLVRKFNSVRGKAYAVLGASMVDIELTEYLIDSLKNNYKQNTSNGWKWIETKLSYANAIIPLSFLSAAGTLKQAELRSIGLEMLNFLNCESKSAGYPIVVGNKGWYEKGGEKAIFDQQPIDAGYQVIANLKAFNLTNDKSYLEEAKEYFLWFWGNNIIKKPLIDKNRESCRDGLCQKGIDKNCGAESTICYLLAQEEIWPYLTDYEKEYMTM
jgi:hypothetical protein